MNKYLRILITVALLIGLAIVLLWLTGNKHILRGIPLTFLQGETKPDIDDMEHFDLRPIESGKGEAWAVKHLPAGPSIAQDYEDRWEKYGNCAMLVIVHDTIRYERYWDGYDEHTYSNSFSMAKSMTSMAVGVAMDEGLIAGPQAKLGDYVPAFAEGLNSELTIEHLLTMSSGIDYGESYSDPFGYQAKAYYGRDLEGETMRYGVAKKPGEEWKYEGGNTVLLSLALEEATGKKLSEYFSEKIWSKIGAEQDAFWNLDDAGGLEKSFSAVYASARDYARLGQLVLDSGRWHGQQLISEEYLKNAWTPVHIPDPEGKDVVNYGWQWWLGEYEGHPFASCRGMRGQYIVPLPHLDAVIVRLGHDRPSEVMDGMTLDLQWNLEFATRLAQELD
ncbi:MAG: CubicO group peptidase (beta-lactamase class C family) [Flavobacteriales bacterium]